MDSDELLRAAEFLLKHQDIRIENASDLERWKKIAPLSLHESLEKLLSLNSMSIREMTEYLKASTEKLKEAIKEITALNDQTGYVSGDCQNEEVAKLIEHVKDSDARLNILLNSVRRNIANLSTDTNE